MTYRPFSFSRIVVAVLSLLSLVTVAGLPDAYAVSSETGHLVTIHDRGKEKSLISDKSTLREVFQEAGITIDPNDIVEPGLDEALIAPSYQVNVYRARPVTIIDGTTKIRVMSAYQTPRQIAEHADIKLQSEDTTTTAISSDIIVDGVSTKLTIDRAAPIQLTLYGKQETVYTQATTVAEFLKDKAISLAESDTLSVDPKQEISSNMEIKIWRNGVQTVTVDEVIQAPVETIQDANREVGYKQITEQGTPGKKAVTYEITMRDGQEVERKEIQSVVVEQPTKQVVVVGAKPAFGGDLAASFAALRQCESGGNYANKNNPTYRGAYQFGYGTWANYGGFNDPADAPPAVQDQAALELYQRRGWQPWPACSQKLGLR